MTEMEVLAEFDGVSVDEIEHYIKPLIAEHFTAETINLTIEYKNNFSKYTFGIAYRCEWSLADFHHKYSQMVTHQMVQASPFPWLICRGRRVDEESTKDQWSLFVHDLGFTGDEDEQERG